MVRRELGLICTTIAAETCEGMAKKATAAFSLGTDIVEFRIDKLGSKTPPATMVKRLGRFGKRAIVTVRPKEEGGGFWGDEEERLELIFDLSASIRPAYLDIELETAKRHEAWFKGLTTGPSRPGKVIVSWHDFAGTPELEVMRGARKEAKGFGEVVKIVTLAKTADDNLKLLMLYQEDARGLIAFCMGPDGTASRILSLQLGSPVVYASLPGEPVAPGQLSVVTVKTLKTMMMARAERGA
ncbi:MAG: type I 3-dehydroquinate dehydratase [Thaumarchaeota archaeon]|nr:type I 3-dehydroquinate dehydratase [Nitrososphaerota archaeon]